MRISAKADYALRACVELAAIEDAGPVKGERIAQRGVEGGYWLAHPAAQITLADVIRAVEGPLANVRGVLETTTLADVAGGDLPAVVRDLLADPEAWAPHP